MGTHHRPTDRTANRFARSLYGRSLYAVGRSVAHATVHGSPSPNRVDPVQ